MHLFTGSKTEADGTANVAGKIRQVVGDASNRHEQSCDLTVEAHVLPGLPPYSSLLDLLPDFTNQPAIRAAADPGAHSLTHADLRSYVHEGFHLGSHGITRSDCVALCLPAGPHAAAAITATLCYCACAPVNPRLALPEITAELQRVHATAFAFLREG